MTKATPDKWDRRRAQGLINHGVWLQQHRTALFTAQSVICEKWYEALESDKPVSFHEFACGVDNAMDLFIETIAKLRELAVVPYGEHDGSVFMPYGCEAGHGVQLLPSFEAEPPSEGNAGAEAS